MSSNISLHRTLQLVADASSAGARLDCFLAKKIPDLSRARAKHLILNGHVTPKLKPSAIVESGQVFTIAIPSPEKAVIIAEEIPLSILHEDEDIIVIEKPARMVVHPGPGNRGGTLVNALLAHCEDLSGIGGELKPGIVHRLDKGTSGVMVVAKNDVAHVKLSEQFQRREVEKVYVALVYGALKGEEGRFETAIGRSVMDRKKISSHTRKRRSALTEWQVVERFGSYLTLVEICLHTGRTHQIRVHFSEAHHPLVGDLTYGGPRQINRIPKGTLRGVLGAFERPALHAKRLGFVHPTTQRKVVFEASLPHDFEELLKKCRGLT